MMRNAIACQLALSAVTALCLAVSLLGTSPPIGSFFFLIPLAHIAMALPVNPPGALGTGEAIYSFLFERVGIAQGGLLSLLMRCVQLGWAALGCLYYLQRKSKVREAVKEVKRSGEPVDPTGEVPLGHRSAVPCRKETWRARPLPARPHHEP